jgi:hypothetical protein
MFPVRVGLEALFSSYVIPKKSSEYSERFRVEGMPWCSFPSSSLPRKQTQHEETKVALIVAAL